MADTFQDILNMQSDDVRAPQPLPIGTYICLVDGQPEFVKVGKDQTDAANFRLKPIVAKDDVNQTELAAALDGAVLSDKSIRHRLFITKASIFRLKNFLDHCKVDSSGTLSQRIAAAPGKEVLASLSHRIADDGQVFQEVKFTAAT